VIRSRKSRTGCPEEPEQRVDEDVQQRADVIAGKKIGERNLEHAARDGRHDAQPGHESTEEHRPRAMLLEPAFRPVKSLWRQTDEGSVAVDQVAAGDARGEVEEGRADHRASHVAPIACHRGTEPWRACKPRIKHEHVAGHGHGHPCLFDQQEDERCQQSVLIEETRRSPADSVHQSTMPSGCLVTQTLAFQRRLQSQ